MLFRSNMALTFNGIAQGFATDRVREVLSNHGFEKALVNIGEYAAGDRTARIGIADENDQIFDIAEIQNQSIATSSPGGYRFADGSGHILSPSGRMTKPVWKTVSLVAEKAVFADGFSTALVLAPDTGLAEQLKADGFVERIVLKDDENRIIRF